MTLLRIETWLPNKEPRGCLLFLWCELPLSLFVTCHDGDDDRCYSLIDLEEVEGPPPDTNENTNAAAAQQQHEYYIHHMFNLTILQEMLA